MSGWDEARRLIERGERTVMGCVVLGQGATGGLCSYSTPCVLCTRLADLDDEGRCYGCRPRPPVCECGGEQRHEVGCPARKAARVVCAWCAAELSPGTEPASHGICGPCSGYVFAPRKGAIR